jgi:hypothetical protein
MKNLVMQVLKYAGWTGFALYSALMVYGLFTLGFKIMEPWLLLEAKMIVLILALKTLALNKETARIIGSRN